MYQYDTYSKVSHIGHSVFRPACNLYIQETIAMSRANNDILLIDDDPSHAKAFEEALIASGDVSIEFRMGQNPVRAASKDWLTREFGQFFSIFFCPIARASKQ